MGPRQDAGEDFVDENQVSIHRIASMGPRQDAGEDAVSPLVDAAVPPRFNGAPAGCRGRPCPECAPLSGRKHASMGPRQDAGEDSSRILYPSSSAQCFNGAPAGCRGRLTDISRVGQILTELQWGPGRMPGKTWRKDAEQTGIRSASMGPRQDAGEDAVGPDPCG